MQPKPNKIRIAGLLLAIFLLIASGCKKTHYQNCAVCACIDRNNISYRDTLIDSADFYQAIIGTWYIKEFDTFLPAGCNSKCYCDTTFHLTILNSKTLSIVFPGNSKDSFNYTFRISGNQVDASSGIFEVPAVLSPFQPVWLQYSNGYLLLYTQTLSAATETFPPNYILTRN